MDPATATALATGGSAILGAFGEERANRINIREAEKSRAFQSRQAARQMDFQERMRNTEWQAAVEDMRAAGINPAVAYSQGPATAPGGAAGGGATAAPAGNVMSSAADTARQTKAMQLMDEQIEKTGAEARAASARAAIEGQRAQYLVGGLGIEGMPSRPPPLNRMLEAEIDRTVHSAQQAAAAARHADAQARVLGPKASLFEFADDALRPTLDWLRNQGGGALNFLRSPN